MSEQLEDDEKNDERRPFEQLIHPRIIAEAMSIYLQLHPVSPQRRFIRQAVEVLRGGGGDRLSHGFLLCARLSYRRQGRARAHPRAFAKPIAIIILRWCAAISRTSAKYALVDNWQYRLLRAHTPGPYTFLLKASRETPRRLKHERRGTIGLRVPDHPVTAMLLSELGEPVMSSTLLLPGEELPRTDAKEIYERLEHSVDLVLDGGNCGLMPTSVIDLSGDRAVVVRDGRGDVTPLCGTPPPYNAASSADDARI